MEHEKVHDTLKKKQGFEEGGESVYGKWKPTSLEPVSLHMVLKSRGHKESLQPHLSSKMEYQFLRFKTCLHTSNKEKDWHCISWSSGKAMAM